MSRCGKRALRPVYYSALSGPLLAYALRMGRCTECGHRIDRHTGADITKYEERFAEAVWLIGMPILVIVAVVSILNG